MRRLISLGQATVLAFGVSARALGQFTMSRPKCLALRCSLLSDYRIFFLGPVKTILLIGSGDVVLPELEQFLLVFRVNTNLLLVSLNQELGQSWHPLCWSALCLDGVLKSRRVNGQLSELLLSGVARLRAMSRRALACASVFFNPLHGRAFVVHRVVAASP